MIGLKAHDVANCILQDVPLISNLGTEFEIKPINYFDRLASMDVQDSDDFQSCAADQGANSGFDYTYATTNTQGFKAGFKYGGALSSRNIFNNNNGPSPALSAVNTGYQRESSDSGPSSSEGPSVEASSVGWTF